MGRFIRALGGHDKAGRILIFQAAQVGSSGRLKPVHPVSESCQEAVQIWIVEVFGGILKKGEQLQRVPLVVKNPEIPALQCAQIIA